MTARVLINNLPSSASGPQDRAKFFYPGAAGLMLVLVALGFQHFYLQGQAFPGVPLRPPIRGWLIAHGVAMTLWILLFCAQPLLIQTSMHKVHMVLGKFGAVLAACIVFLGVRVALGAAKVNPPDDLVWDLAPKQFLAIPLTAILLFAGYVTVGLWNRRRPQIHKPMMFLATLTAVNAATDRIDFIYLRVYGTTLGTLLGTFLAPTVIGLGLLLIKWALTRSFDRALAAGLAVLAIAGALSMKLATTPAWDRLAGSILR